MPTMNTVCCANPSDCDEGGMPTICSEGERNPYHTAGRSSNNYEAARD
jgi:hypothetical protein